MWCGAEVALDVWTGLPAVAAALHVEAGPHEFAYEIQVRRLIRLLLAPHSAADTAFTFIGAPPSVGGGEFSGIVKAPAAAGACCGMHGPDDRVAPQRSAPASNRCTMLIHPGALQVMDLAPLYTALSMRLDLQFVIYNGQADANVPFNGQVRAGHDSAG